MSPGLSKDGFQPRTYPGSTSKVSLSGITKTLLPVVEEIMNIVLFQDNVYSYN